MRCSLLIIPQHPPGGPLTRAVIPQSPGPVTPPLKYEAVAVPVTPRGAQRGHAVPPPPSLSALTALLRSWGARRRDGTGRRRHPQIRPPCNLLRPRRKGACLSVLFVKGRRRQGLRDGPAMCRNEILPVRAHSKQNRTVHISHGRSKELHLKQIFISSEGVQRHKKRLIRGIVKVIDTNWPRKVGVGGKKHLWNFKSIPQLTEAKKVAAKRPNKAAAVTSGLHLCAPSCLPLWSCMSRDLLDLWTVDLLAAGK
ncbi:hypothetical protein SKAU_G00176660 [Synaphobranchus kaupii]|uniref:Uncharacterized protein n=1 Tax=Synaphobranchus kaupii TaxID=118154 RepID=A0A9Q1J0C3_SYNKA|nr:hypothetical protein SKAU_G00176660 [Synaphobranchus kaupii]